MSVCRESTYLDRFFEAINAGLMDENVTDVLQSVGAGCDERPVPEEIKKKLASLMIISREEDPHLLEDDLDDVVWEIQDLLVDVCTRAWNAGYSQGTTACSMLFQYAVRGIKP